ncbi:MAG: methyltransferase domain-containing protein, partial [Acetobacteraceae bacterium]|nr:methyltransferase domain-containing protein [Acetobacteraceae bacterium]
FDAVTAFNSLQFTANPRAALAEVRRVAKPGAIVFALVFGREERVPQAAGWRALAPLLPPRPAGSPVPLAPSQPEVLDDLLRASGLTPGRRRLPRRVLGVSRPGRNVARTARRASRRSGRARRRRSSCE